MDDINQPYPTMYNGEYVKLDTWIQNSDRLFYNNNELNVKTVSLQRENYPQTSIPFERYKSDKLCTNRLGGQYSSGRPLPMPVREKIVELAKHGLKPCQISKQLQVSHGCVSKLLTRWRKTGSVQPERIGGSTPKKVLPYVATAIKVYKRWRPHLQTWQIRQRLITDGICTPQNVPSISSINKTLRTQLAAKLENPTKKDTENTGAELKKYLFSNANCHEKMPSPAYSAAVTQNNNNNNNNDYANYRNVLEQNNVPLSCAPNFQVYGIQQHSHPHHTQQQQYSTNIYNHHIHQQSPTSNVNNSYAIAAPAVNPSSYVSYRDVTPTYYKYSYVDDMHSVSSGSDSGVYITHI